MATGNVSLLDVAKNMADSKEKGAILTYATTSHVLTHMPMESQPNGMKKWKIVADLAYSSSGSAYRNIGSNFTTTKTPTQPFAANIKIAGGEVTLDRALKVLAPANIAVEKRGQLAANARQITIDVFEGLGGTAIWGIDEWISNVEIFKNQTMSMGTASAGGLITEDGLDEFIALQNVIPGQTFMYMNDAPARRVKKLSRGQSSASSGDYFYNINYRPEEFGFFAGAYDGIPIVTMKDGKGTDMLSNTEGDGASTTVYLITYGVDNYTGFEAAPMSFIDMTDTTVLEAFNLEHYMNAVPQSIRCVSRMRYVTNGVV